MKKSVLQFSAVLLTCAFPALMQAQIVTSGADDNTDGTLRKEIADTPPGGTVTITPLVTSINLNSEIIINKTLIINGNAALPPTINAQSNGRVFNVTTGTITLNNMTMTNGLATDGGAIQINGATVILNNVGINNSVANGASGSGGAILVGSGGRLLANTSTFTSNRSNRAGGAIEVTSTLDSALVLTGCTFTTNNTGVTPATPNPGNGGAIHVTGSGNTYITGGTAVDNVAASEGGAFWNGTGMMLINGTTLDGNSAAGATATEGGGGAFNAGGTLIVKSATFIDNSATGSAGSGGAIFNDLGVLLVDTSSFDGNSSARAGGAIEVNSGTGTSLTINGSDFDNNDAGTNPGNGGAVHITGAATTLIKGGTYSGNTATQGGALWNGSGTMVIDSVSITGNTATGNAADKGGGGVYNLSGTVNIINETNISNNVANGLSGSGGGVLTAAGTVNIFNSSVDANQANRAGGGIEIINGNLTVRNSTINDNNVDGAAGTPSPGSGGAVHVTGNTAVTIIDSTEVDGNSARLAGGGLWNQSGATMTVTFSNISNNTAGQNGGGIFNTGGTMVVSRSAVFSNTATNANGGGIMNSSGIMAVGHSTISGNESGNNGGGIYNADSMTVNAATIYQNNADVNGGGIFGVDTVYFQNTMILTNGALLGQEVDGAVKSMGYNIIENDDNNALTLQSTDTADVIIVLPALALNNSVTFSHAIIVGNLAIDRGNPADNSKDQRGRDPVNTRDVGAYEYTANVGINEVADIDLFTVYPNPATEVVNVRLANAKQAQVTITDINGKIVKQMAMGEELSIPVSSLNHGVYLLTVRTGNSVQTQQFQVR